MSLTSTGPRIRDVARNLSYRRRIEEALSSHEQVECRRLRQLLLMIVTKRRKLEVEGADITLLNRQDEFKRLVIIKYLFIVNNEFDPLLAIKNKFRTIASFRVDECGKFFRFKKAYLQLLCRLLRFNDRMDIGSQKLDGEEIFLRGLFELSTGMEQNLIVEFFGGCQPLQSRSFIAFINHVYDNFSHLLTDNLKWFHENGIIKESADAIWAKIVEKGFNFPSEYTNMIALFIDCNCLPTSCVGGGPAEQGANAARWDGQLHEAFYNGL